MDFSVTAGGRVDWKAERDRVNLAAVATNLLGPAPGRRGERGRRLWWPCPFHQDANPSFCVDPGSQWWHCYGCGEKGDAANLVMRLEGLTFPQAVQRLVGGFVPSRPGATRPTPKPTAKPTPKPTGLPEADALALVETAAERLWTPEGVEALAYLTGPRCLSAETIRAARLGWTPGVLIPTHDGDRFYQAHGWVIPWFAGDRPALVKVRQPDGARPKYAEAFRDPSRLVCYPGADAIEPGRPLVVVEGEFDAMCLGQELAGLAVVVTLGSASNRPDPMTRGQMLAASPWYIATDGDVAGDKAAGEWPPTALRIRPPGVSKDWTEAKANGVNLRRWWAEILAGNLAPALFAWEELAVWRWGEAAHYATPGIIVF